MDLKTGFRKVITLGGIVSVVGIIAALSNPEDSPTYLLLGSLSIAGAILLNLLYNNDNA